MGQSDLLIFATVAGSALAFGLPAVWALAWAFNDGQFRNFERGARSIFGPDEPEGRLTDTALASPPERDLT